MTNYTVIKCSRFGIRGKIDATLSVEVRGQNKGSILRKIIPLELKTGRSSNSAEHKAQVTDVSKYAHIWNFLFPDYFNKFFSNFEVMLYNLLLYHAYKNVDDRNLVLYLKDGQINQSMVKFRDLKGIYPLKTGNIHCGIFRVGILQLRNTLATCLEDFGKLSSKSALDYGASVEFDLPDPISSTRFCTQCPHLLNCCLMSKYICWICIFLKSRFHSLISFIFIALLYSYC